MNRDGVIIGVRVRVRDRARIRVRITIVKIHQSQPRIVALGSTKEKQPMSIEVRPAMPKSYTSEAQTPAAVGTAVGEDEQTRKDRRARGRIKTHTSIDTRLTVCTGQRLIPASPPIDLVRPKIRRAQSSCE